MVNLKWLRITGLIALTLSLSSNQLAQEKPLALDSLNNLNGQNLASAINGL